jgi:DNA-binding response OmpR family regulator
MAKDCVLIIDDARTTRTHLQLMLSAQYDCAVAESAETGLDLARSMTPPPRAILLDVQMPGIGGIEALKRLKADETLKVIPVIMVTTRGEEETLAECQAAGCDGYVTKPVQTGELFTVIRNLLRGSR